MSKPGNLPAADRRRLYPLWTVLVFLNATVSLFIALDVRGLQDRAIIGQEWTNTGRCPIRRMCNVPNR